MTDQRFELLETEGTVLIGTYQSAPAEPVIDRDGVVVIGARD